MLKGFELPAPLQPFRAEGLGRKTNACARTIARHRCAGIFFCVRGRLIKDKMVFLQRKPWNGYSVRDGLQTYKKALSQRLICGVSNFANSISCCTVRQWSMSRVLYIPTYTYSVGFGIAYPRMKGNAKA